MGMALRELVLSAGALSDDECHGAEKAEGAQYRWTKATPLTWRPNFHGMDGISVVIPFLIEIEPTFLERSKLFLNGEERPFVRETIDGVRCLKADTDLIHVWQVRLETPEPITSPSTPSDTRKLGAALLVRRISSAEQRAVPKLANVATGAIPKIALIGNCQVQTYEWLIQQMLGASPLVVADFSDAIFRQPKAKQDFITTCGEADVVLAMQSQYVPLADIRAGCDTPTYAIANMYFRGTFPDACYVGSIDQRLEFPTAYNSLVILDAFKRGIPVGECRKLFAIDNFQRLGLTGAWASSVAMLEKFDRALDFPAARLIVDSALSYNAFLTINHPSVLLCYTYLASIFDQLGIAYKPLQFPTFHDPLSEHSIAPIHNEWAEYLKLPYRTTQLFKVNKLDFRYVERTELIERFYRTYAEVPFESLAVNSPTDLVEDLKHDPNLRYLVNL